MTDSYQLTPEEVLESRQQLRNAQVNARLVPRKDVVALRELDHLAARRAKARKFLDDEDRYKALKTKFLKALEDVPALTFYEDGEQRFATARRSTKIVVDEDLLEKVMRELGYNQADIDKVIPRKLNAEALRRLVSSTRGRPLQARMEDFAREVPHISYVVFTDPVGDDDEEVDDVT